MNSNFDNKLTDIKQAEQTRRTELAMMGLLMDRYPEQARAKLRKGMANKNAVNIGKTLVFKDK